MDLGECLMEKKVRKAVKCFLIRNNKVVVTKYKAGNRKEGYYDIPGGKIEEGEAPEDTVKREFREETGMIVKKLKYRGTIVTEYPDRIFTFETFITESSEGEPQEFEENTSEWIEIEELLKKEKLLSNIMMLDRFFIKGLLDNTSNFEIHICVNEDEEILNVEYKII